MNKTKKTYIKKLSALGFILILSVDVPECSLLDGVEKQIPK